MEMRGITVQIKLRLFNGLNNTKSSLHEKYETVISDDLIAISKTEGVLK